MKSSIAFAVWHQSISFFIGLPAALCIICCLLRKIIFINEVISRVIGRIDVNYLHLPQIRFLEKLQGIQIIAFDVDILRVRPAGGPIPSHRFFFFEAKCLGNGRIRKGHGFSLIRPGKLVPFLPIVHHLGIDFLHQYILVDGPDRVSILILCFRHRIREQGCQLLIVFLCQIRRMHLKLVHG